MKLEILSGLLIATICGCVSPEIKQARLAERVRLRDQSQAEAAGLKDQREAERVGLEEQRLAEYHRQEKQRQVEEAKLEEQRQAEAAKKKKRIREKVYQEYGTPDRTLASLGTPTNRTEGDEIFIFEYLWSGCACHAILSYDKKTKELVDWRIKPCQSHGYKRFGFAEME